MKKIFVIFIITLASLVHAQNFSNSIICKIDQARYYYSKDSVLLESYLLLTQKTENNIIISDTTKVEFSIFNEDSILVSQKKFDIVQGINDLNTVLLVKSILPQGKYTSKLFIYNLNGSKKLLASRKISIYPFNLNKLMLSDIELSFKIESSAKDKDMFYKNTLSVVPNPISTFNSENSRLFYYIEIYDPVFSSQSIQLREMVTDLKGNEIFSKSKKIISKNKRIVNIGNFNLFSLKSGYYALVILANDTLNKTALLRKKIFYYKNKNQKEEIAVDENFKKHLISKVSKEEFQDIFSQSLYFMDATTKNSFFNYSFSNEALRKKLYQFWQEYTGSGGISFQTLLNRVQEADEMYDTNRKKGWQTDRGRIYIVYGKPDQIERHHSESDTNPYEIWHYYEIYGGIEFDFVDYDQLGSFKLVSSTHPDEFFDPNWKNMYLR